MYWMHFRRRGKKWWVTVIHNKAAIVGSNETWTLRGARRWARRVARRGDIVSGPWEWREEVLVSPLEVPAGEGHAEVGRP